MTARAPAPHPPPTEAERAASRRMAIALRSAEFSACGEYRERLDRWWSDRPRALVCGCNPSQAGMEKNDPTIHAVAALTAHLPVGGFTMANWSPRISTDPDGFHRWRLALLHADEPAYAAIRDANLARLRALSADSAVRIVAWGNLVPMGERETTLVLRALSLDGLHPLYAFGLTGAGVPKHPLARGKTRIAPGTPLTLWRPATHALAERGVRPSEATGAAHG